MTLNELLTELSQRQITIRYEEGKLNIRAPKGALTPELKQILSERKAEILSTLEQVAQVTTKQIPPLQPVSREQNLPLSAAQERLWNLASLAPENAVYNLSTVLHLTGFLKISTLEESIVEIIHRHEILRTYFEKIDDFPVQKIINNLVFKLPIIDLRDLPPEQQAIEVKRLATKQVKQPFKLENDLLWRVQLLRLSEDESVLILVMHHLIADGWSFRVFFQEVSALYEAFLQQQLSSLPEVPVQYADFAQWQNQWLESPSFESQVKYWQQQLEGYLSPLQLPSDLSFSPSISTAYQGGYHPFQLPQNLWQNLKQLSQQEGVTLFMTLLAAFKTLLYCYKAQEDILVCSPVVGRTPTETEALIGYFNNIVPLRSQLKDSTTFRELLKQVRLVATEAYEHQDLPFQRIVELPNIKNVSLTKAMFNLDKAASQALKLPGIAVKVLHIFNDSANFDLSLIFEESNDLIIGVWNYKTNLFSAETISLLAECFITLITNLIPDPDQSISDLRQKISFSDKIFISSLPTETNAKAPYVAPNNEIERQLVSLWESYFKTQPIGIKDNFFALGGHSLLALQLFSHLEKKYGKNLSLASLFQVPTIEQLAKLLQDTNNSTSWSSLVAIQPQGSKPPLFCIHAVGGNILIYLRLSHYLGTDQPVYGLQAQGLDGKTAFHTRIEDMATHYLQEIRALFPQGPYLFSGLSGGGVIAFEMAQQLQAQGEKATLVVLFDTYNPKYIRMRTQAHQKFIQSSAGGLLVKLFLRREFKVLDTKTKKLLRFLNFWLSPQVKLKDKLSYLGQIINKLLITINFMAQVIIYRFFKNQDKTIPYLTRMKIITNNLRVAVKNYIPEKYSGKVILFRANHSVYLINNQPDSDDLGWQEFVTNKLDIHKVSGDHGTILAEPYVQVLATQLKTCLDNIDNTNSSIQ